MEERGCPCRDGQQSSKLSPRACAVLKALHFVKHILNEEECRRVGKDGVRWTNELAIVIVSKPPDAVQETLSVLKKEKRSYGYSPTAEGIILLSALHQEKLVTEDAIERMKGERRDLSDSVVLIQCSMPSKVVARTANVLDRYGHNEEARQLRALNELFTRHLLTAEKCSEMARKGRKRWKNHLTLFLLTKPAEEMQEACQVLEKYGCPVKEQLKTLNELFTRHILTAEECSEVAKKESWEWEDHLTQLMLTKSAVVVLEAIHVLKIRGYSVKKVLQMLSELYQEKLVTEEDVKRMKEEGGDLSDRLVFVQCTKPPEVVTKSASVLDKYEHNEEARKLRALNELFPRHILTAEECSEVARKKSWNWEYHLTLLLLTKSAVVVQEAVHVLKINGYSVKKELQMLSELYQEKLVTEDEVKRMKGKRRDLSGILVLFQFTNPPEVVAKSASVLDKYGHNEEAIMLTALNELFTRHILTAEECSEVAKKNRSNWEYHLTQLLPTKSAVVVQEAIHVLKISGYSVKELQMLSELYQEKLVIEDEVKRMKGKRGDLSGKLTLVQFTKPPEVVARSAGMLDRYGHNAEARKLRALNELFTRHILTSEECSEVAKMDGWNWMYHLTQLLPTKSAVVVQEAIHVLKILGYSVEKELQMLSELYQEKLVIEDEVKRLKGEGMALSTRFVFVQCTKPPELVARSASVLDKYGHKIEARKLTVLSELYQEKLVIEDEAKRLAGEGRALSLSDGFVLVQCTKPPELVPRSASVLDKYGHNEEARKLRALNELFTRHILTAEECSEVARKKSWKWEYHLTQLLLTKSAVVVQEAIHVLKISGNSVKKELQMLFELYQEELVIKDEVKRMKEEGGDLSDGFVFVQCTKPPELVARSASMLDKYGHNMKARKLRALNELFTRHILTAEECSEVAKKDRWDWEYHLTLLLLTKSAVVVQEAIHVIKTHGYSVKDELQMLFELYQEELVIEDEVKRMKGGYLSDGFVLVQCTKPPELVARSASMLDKYGHNVEARKLRALNELFTRHILTAEECSEVAKKDRRNWEYHLTQLLLTKSAVVVQEAIYVLKIRGYYVKKELQMLSGLYQKKLVTEDEVKRLKEGGRALSDRLAFVQCTKPPELVARSTNVLDRYGHNEEARKLRVLSKLYQDKLVTEDEVERMKGEGMGLFDKLVLVQCTKPPELVARSANVLDKYGYNEEARKLRALSELYQEKLVTEDEVERMKEEGDLFYRLVQYTMNSEEVTRTAKVLEKYGHDFEASLLRGEVPIPHGNMPGKKCYDYLLLKSVWRYKNISKAATSTHSTSHLLEEPSLSHTKRSSEEVEEETKHQGSKALSQSTGEGSGPPREPDIAKVKAKQFSVSEFLKKHEAEFFEVVNPKLSLLGLVRKGIITEYAESCIDYSNTKDAQEFLYHRLAHHANVDTLKEYCEVAIDAEGFPKMQSLGRKMMEELEKRGEQTTAADETTSHS